MQTSLHTRCAAARCLQSGRGGEPSLLVLEMRPVSCAEGRSPEGPTPAPPVPRRRRGWGAAFPQVRNLGESLA